VFEDDELITYGILEADKKKDIMERMYQMYFSVKKLYDNVNPDFVFIEDTHYQRNFASFQSLSQMQGVILSILFEKNVGFQIVKPSTWKSVTKVKGRKRKEQKESAMQIVKEKYKINVSEDVAEAILIGLWGTKLFQKEKIK